MQKLNKDLNLTDLDSWGTVVDLGSEVLSGNGKCYGKVTLGNPTENAHAGYFAVEKSKFRMTYPFNEQATVVKGRVTLTNEGTGEQQTFNEGESWMVTKGTQVLWQVESDYFIKHYFAAVELV